MTQTNRATQAKLTREHFLRIAKRHFADFGFDGTSIAGIVAEVGMTKQALLHHFGNKQKLYAEVLKQISAPSVEHSEQFLKLPPRAQLERLIIGRKIDDTETTRLVMRELLDNKTRAESAGYWVLKPYLDNLVSVVRSIPGEQNLSDAEALATVYQLLGAISYFQVSTPTLSKMYGSEIFEATKQQYPVVLKRLIRSRFPDAT